MSIGTGTHPLVLDRSCLFSDLMGLLELGRGNLRVGHLFSSLYLLFTQMWATSAKACPPLFSSYISFSSSSFFSLSFLLALSGPIPSAKSQAIT